MELLQLRNFGLAAFRGFVITPSILLLQNKVWERICMGTILVQNFSFGKINWWNYYKTPENGQTNLSVWPHSRVKSRFDYSQKFVVAPSASLLQSKSVA